MREAVERLQFPSTGFFLHGMVALVVTGTMVSMMVFPNPLTFPQL